jgi:hypothetical protein
VSNDQGNGQTCVVRALIAKFINPPSVPSKSVIAFSFGIPLTTCSSSTSHPTRFRTFDGIVGWPGQCSRPMLEFLVWLLFTCNGQPWPSAPLGCGASASGVASEGSYASITLNYHIIPLEVIGSTTGRLAQTTTPRHRRHPLNIQSSSLSNSTAWYFRAFLFGFASEAPCSLGGGGDGLPWRSWSLIFVGSCGR